VGIFSAAGCKIAAKPFDVPIAAAAGEGTGACAIVEGGRVQCWFRNATFGVPGIADAVSLSVHEQEGCAVRLRAGVTCWRYSADFGKARVDVEDVNLDSPTRVAVAVERACAVVADGGVSCWQTNRHPPERVTPTRAPGLDDVVDLALHGANALALRRDGTIVELGVDAAPSAFRIVARAPDATQVAIGENFRCLRTGAGTVSCWGNNWMGVLGDGTNIAHEHPRPVVGLSHVAEIAAGQSHVCARHDDGSVSCWGSNQYNQLGVDSTGLSDSRRLPVRVPDLRASSLVGGTCAITQARSLVCWGFPDAEPVERLAPR
jgi:hypothetical protein